MHNQLKTVPSVEERLRLYFFRSHMEQNPLQRISANSVLWLAAKNINSSDSVFARHGPIPSSFCDLISWLQDQRESDAIRISLAHNHLRALELVNL